jgi:hypothetical protein
MENWSSIDIDFLLREMENFPKLKSKFLYSCAYLMRIWKDLETKTHPSRKFSCCSTSKVSHVILLTAYKYTVPNRDMREFLSTNQRGWGEQFWIWNKTNENWQRLKSFSFFLSFISSDVVSWISTLNYPPNDPIKYFSFFPFDVMVVLCSFDVHLYIYIQTRIHIIRQFLSQTFSSFYFSSSQTFLSCAARWSQKNSFRFCCSVFSMS